MKPPFFSNKLPDYQGNNAPATLLNVCLSTVNVAHLVVAGDNSLQGSLNTLVRQQTEERVWQAIYGQLNPKSRVALNHIDRHKRRTGNSSQKKRGQQ